MRLELCLRQAVLMWLVQIMLATEEAEYICVRPAASYKKLFSHLAEQADMTYQVLLFLLPRQPSYICTMQ